MTHQGNQPDSEANGDNDTSRSIINVATASMKVGGLPVNRAPIGASVSTLATKRH